MCLAPESRRRMSSGFSGGLSRLKLSRLTLLIVILSSDDSATLVKGNSSMYKRRNSDSGRRWSNWNVVWIKSTLNKFNDCLEIQTCSLHTVGPLFCKRFLILFYFPFLKFLFSKYNPLIKATSAVVIQLIIFQFIKFIPCSLKSAKG